MEIKTLVDTPLSVIVETFNKAFVDYFVKIELTEEALAFKMRQENLDLRFSGGAFDQGKLVGFILNGIGFTGRRKEAYNGGTGVVAEYRGQRLTQKIYQYLFPLFWSADVLACRLEVIDENEPAIAVYKKLGFKATREFDCRKGMVNPKLKHPKIDLIVLEKPPWKTFPAYWNAHPSWSFSLEANQRIQDHLTILGAFHKKLLVGYAMFLPESGRITQFAVHPRYRRKQIGDCLFSMMARLGNPKMTVINIDKTDKGTIAFLRQLGFSSYIGQYEMELLL